MTVIAESFQGKRLNSPNDAVVHRDGAIWFTDPPYGHQLYEGGATRAPQRELPTNVYRVDPSGRVDMVIPGGAGPGSERPDVLARLQAALRREHGERTRRHRPRRQR